MNRPLVVLDVDDTLYLERDYVRSGFKAVASYLEDNFGIEDFWERAWRLFNSGARGNIFDLVLANDVRLAGRFDPWTLVEIYREHVPAISLLPDAREFINECRRRADVAVVTDGPIASQRAKLRALDADEWANEIVVTSEKGMEWHKPSTRAFAYLQEHFRASAGDCAYFGDNPCKDFIGPKALGWRTVRVRRLGGLHESVVDNGGALLVVRSFVELEAGW